MLRWEGLLVKKTKRFHITTDSKHGFYKSPNLLKNAKIKHAEQVLVSDITYIKTDTGHTYLALVTDVYSKKIMGYDYADNMKAELCINALKMAKKKLYSSPFRHYSSFRPGNTVLLPCFLGICRKKRFYFEHHPTIRPLRKRSCRAC